MAFQAMRAARIKLLSAGIAAVPWSTAKIGLYKVAKIPTQHDLLADYTQCDFTGYALASLTWNSVYISASGLVVVDAPSIQFAPTDGVTPNTCFGYLITDSAGAVLLGAGNFNTPVPMTDATCALSIYPSLGFAAPTDPNANSQGGP
jgi:hypothetical protein